MLPIISTKKTTSSTGVNRGPVSALPAAAASKKIKKRPRAVLPPSSKKKSNSSNTNDSNNSSSHQEHLLEHAKISHNNNNNNAFLNHVDDENALLFAAEAAAAIIMEKNNSDCMDIVGGGGETSHDNNIMNAATLANTASQDTTNHTSDSLELLENVIVASVKKAQGGNGTAWGRNNDDTCYYQNPLGPSYQVQTFESRVVSSASTSSSSSSSLLEMSQAQRNFLSYYYTTVEGNGQDGDRNNLDLNIDDEEIIEEDDADDDDTRNNNYHHNGISTVQTKTTLSGGGEIATKSEDDVVAPSTLRDLCRKIPRSTYRKKTMKTSNDKQKKEVTFLEGDEMVHIFKNDEDGVLVDGVAVNPATASFSAVTTTEDRIVIPSGPQVTVDEHGTIVIAHESLLPNPDNRQSTAEIDQELLGGGSVIDEGDAPSQLGAIQARYDSYTAVPRTVPVRWSVRETRDFYNALRQCGTDFTLMQMYCLGRTRAQLKRKFKVESRKNARLVDMALDPKCKVKLDISIFGDSLEIPEDVPSIVREVTPTLSAIGGVPIASSNSTKRMEDDDAGIGNEHHHDSAIGKYDHHGTKGNYDHLFDDEDGADFSADKVSDDTTKQLPADFISGTFTNAVDSGSSQRHPAVLPVAAPKTIVKKKTRFKAKPSKGKSATNR